jgi:hypothetical protein
MISGNGHAAHAAAHLVPTALLSQNWPDTFSAPAATPNSRARKSARTPALFTNHSVAFFTFRFTEGCESTTEDTKVRTKKQTRCYDGGALTSVDVISDGRTRGIPAERACCVTVASANATCSSSFRSSGVMEAHGTSIARSRAASRSSSACRRAARRAASSSARRLRQRHVHTTSSMKQQRDNVCAHGGQRSEWWRWKQAVIMVNVRCQPLLPHAAVDRRQPPTEPLPPSAALPTLPVVELRGPLAVPRRTSRLRLPHRRSVSDRPRGLHASPTQRKSSEIHVL